MSRMSIEKVCTLVVRDSLSVYAVMDTREHLAKHPAYVRQTCPRSLSRRRWLYYFWWNCEYLRSIQDRVPTRHLFLHQLCCISWWASVNLTSPGTSKGSLRLARPDSWMGYSAVRISSGADSHNLIMLSLTVGAAEDVGILARHSERSPSMVNIAFSNDFVPLVLSTPEQFEG